ncbi:MAG: hypothetical protein J6Q82_06940 [Clostridia bacterium]|nr:hypothetical protein [Clostridia bacterium]
MKKYTSRATKWLAIYTIISAIILVIGVILIIANFSNLGLQIGLTMLGGLLSVVFLSCFFAEKSRWLTINGDEIVLPRGADINGKMVFKRTVAKIDEITSVESNLYKGDGLISKDTYFHTLKLKDGTKITFTLYAYGKEAEKEIIETIKKSV